MLVFVYGTLKTGEVSESLMRKTGGTLIGEAETIGQYTMYGNSGWFPRVYKHRVTSPIRGELWSIDADLCVILDNYEGHPEFFKREKVLVVCGGSQFSAWMYFIQSEDELDEEEINPTGFWSGEERNIA